MPPPPLLGAHQSIAGGHARAVERAVAAGCLCLQLFTKNNLRWNDKPLTDEGAALFRKRLKESGVKPAVAHAGYLANLATPKEELRVKSMDALHDEMARCERLGVKEIIVHPGMLMGAGADEGIARIAEGVNVLLRAHPRVSVLLENTAGAGSSIGGDFGELAAVLARVRAKKRAGVCFDTCHAFAAGHDLRTPKAWRDVAARLADTVGLEKVRAFHFNDSAFGLGEHKDRHAHIGLGRIGDGGFRGILRDERFRNVPKILETPKGKHGGRTWDEVNLERLRGLGG